MSLPPSDWGEINLTARWLLGGSFDIQADYELLNWPAHSGGTVGLLAMFPDDVEWDWVLRTSGRNPVGDQDELYLANVRTRYECICDGRTPTSDTSGRFRLTRDDDSLLTFYFWSSDTADWVPIYTRAVPSDDVRIRLTCWGPVTAPEGVAVAFDNFQVNSGEIIVGGVVIEDVQISRGKWTDSWDWPTYHQRALVRVREAEPGSTACFVIEEPTGGRYVYSMCAGGAWPDWYGSFPTNWDLWVVRNDERTLL
ncbi:MAG: hypothetical protein GTO22_00495 [Gemmatimonadales bacterium]|nr:hypothetical protein [Gemmatimonadales bacterium]